MSEFGFYLKVPEVATNGVFLMRSFWWSHTLWDLMHFRYTDFVPVHIGRLAIDVRFDTEVTWSVTRPNLLSRSRCANTVELLLVSISWELFTRHFLCDDKRELFAGFWGQGLPWNTQLLLCVIIDSNELYISNRSMRCNKPGPRFGYNASFEHNENRSPNTISSCVTGCTLL